MVRHFPFLVYSKCKSIWCSLKVFRLSVQYITGHAKQVFKGELFHYATASPFEGLGH